MVRPLCAMGAYAARFGLSGKNPRYGRTPLWASPATYHSLHIHSKFTKYHLKRTQFLPYYKKSKEDSKTPNFPITSKSKHSIFAIFLNEIINIMESIFATLLETLITF